MVYSTLDSEKIVGTLVALGRRIEDRFPGAGLSSVCQELIAIARESKERGALLDKPNRLLRAVSASVIVLGALGMIYVASIMSYTRQEQEFFGVLQGIDSLVSVIVIIGGALLFLVTLESRWKRQKALAYLDELRSIIHVIDMHQLTKDPSAVLRGGTTAHSPARTMSPHQLTRYLDYCSEMLSLASKVAAVYAQSAKDAEVVAAAGDLGQMASNLNLKIWQKISLVQSEPVESSDPAN